LLAWEIRTVVSGPGNLAAGLFIYGLLLILGGMVALVVGLFATSLAQKAIGVPLVGVPYSLTVESKESFDKFADTLRQTLHSSGCIPSAPHRLDEVKISAPLLLETEREIEGRRESFTLAVMTGSRDGKSVCDIICYQDRGSEVWADRNCGELLADISALFRTKDSHLETSALGQASENGPLKEWALDYTQSKLQLFLDKYIPLIRSHTSYIVISLLAGASMYLVFPVLLRMAGPTIAWIHDYGSVISAIGTILGLLGIRERANKWWTQRREVEKK
jgi:hypothetical protein